MERRSRSIQLSSNKTPMAHTILAVPTFCSAACSTVLQIFLFSVCSIDIKFYTDDILTNRFSGSGTSIGPVCVSACQMVTFKLNGRWLRYLACCMVHLDRWLCLDQIAILGSKVKVQGHKRKQELNNSWMSDRRGRSESRRHTQYTRRNL